MIAHDKTASFFVTLIHSVGHEKRKILLVRRRVFYGEPRYISSLSEFSFPVLSACFRRIARANENFTFQRKPTKRLVSTIVTTDDNTEAVAEALKATSGIDRPSPPPRRFLFSRSTHLHFATWEMQSII